MAISRAQKTDVVSQYQDWLNRSQAAFVSEYTGLDSKQIGELRIKIRQAGGEFHVVKNTLGRLVLETAGHTIPAGLLEGSTAFCFAFNNAPDVAKALTEFARTSEKVNVKGGFLGKSTITPDQVKALADLPPLPVMRAQLMGTLLAPASQLVRILAEPGRQVAAVVKAYADKDTATASA